MFTPALAYRASRRVIARGATAFSLALLYPLTAYAAGAGTAMPWDTPLQKFEQDITGPVAKAVGIIAVVAFALMFSYGEHGSSLRKAGGLMFGLSIAFTATTFVPTFFGYSGGAAFPLAHAITHMHLALGR